MDGVTVLKGGFRAVLLSCILLVPNIVRSQPFTYQGRLKDGGSPANGVYDLQFALYDAPNGGKRFGVVLTNAATAVSNGLFTVALDFGAGSFAGDSIWLQVGVRASAWTNYTTLSPRQAITAAPYSMYANSAGYLAGGGSSLSNLPASALVPGSIQIKQLDPTVWLMATNKVARTNAKDFGISTFDSIAATNFGGNAAGLTNILRGFTTPYEFGAVGDGVADDTVALQSWLSFATASNLVAFLPPANGPYYKITDSLKVTSLGGLRLIGAGGAFHTTSAQIGRAHIRQFTPGKDGLVIAGESPGNGPPAVPSDSIYVDGINISTAVFGGYSTHGLAFDANDADSDCDLIQNCGVRGFGKGLYIRSAADLSVIACSFGENGDGIFVGREPSDTNAFVVNSIGFYGCQLSYNYSNQVHVLGGGSIAINSSDIANVDPGSAGVFVDGNGFVTLNQCNMENYSSTAPCILATATTPSSIRVTINQGSAGGYGPGAYSIIATNAQITLHGAAMNSACSSNGLAALECSTDSNSHIFSDSSLGSLFVFNTTAKTNVASLFQTGFGSHQALKSGEFFITKHSAAWDQYHVSTGGWDDTTALVFGAQFAGFSGSPIAVENDLLQYQKDAMTLMPTRNLSVGGRLVGSRSTGVIGSSAFALDFGGSMCSDLTLAVANVTFSTINATGTATNYDRKVFLIRSGGAAASLSWPTQWTVMGAALPASLGAGKILRLELESVGAGESNILATATLSR
jgi:hypothetical protein